MRFCTSRTAHFLALLLTGCGGDDNSSGGQSGSGGQAGSGGSDASPGSGGGAGSSGAGGTSAVEDASSGALEASCPDGFTPQDGENRGFVSDGAERWFHLMLPGEMSSPRPLFVSLTGTVQPELDFAAQSGLDQLPSSGWIVAAPVRTCSQLGTTCAMVGSDERIWEPWYDSTKSGPTDDEGPDVRFVEAMVRCIATHWPVDEQRIYVGGISAGGTFTNRNLAFNSDFFAGGVPASGNWFTGSVLPASPVTMDPSIAIIIWGGPTDEWPAGSTNDYDRETKAASQFFAAQENVVTVSCSGTHGHVWPAMMTPWLAETLLSHPKGTPAAAFELTEPPSGFSCVLGEYTDH